VEEGLPFRLPRPPTDHDVYFNDMLRFFETENGRIALALNDLTADFNKVKSADQTDSAIPPKPLQNCFSLYFEAAEVTPTAWAPGADDGTLRKVASTGPSEEMRLAYYVVESDRLSRNKNLTRILLTTADTLLEFFGENAGTFISNPKTAVVVEDLLNEFAVKHDFDDESLRQIYKRLLNSLAIAVLDNPGVFPNRPLLKALFGALNDLRSEMGDEFVARLITEEGFEALVSAFLSQVAEDPAFITADKIAQEVIAASLRELGQHFPQILEGDKKAVFGVIEAGLVVGTAHVDTILDRKLGGHPLLSVVLSEAAKTIHTLASQDALFKELAAGEIFSDLYKTVLETIAANPAALAEEADIKTFTADLIAIYADSMSRTKIKDVFRTETLRELIHGSLTIMSRYPELVGRDNRFATQVVEAIFAATAPLVKDGFRRDDILAVLDTAVAAANENLALLETKDSLTVILSAVGESLARDSVKGLLTSKGRKDALLAAVGAVAVNPKVWRNLESKDLVQPLVVGLLSGIENDPTKLLSGPVLVDYLRRSLTAAARRGKSFVDEDLDPGVLQAVVAISLESAEKEIGKTIDGEVLPVFLERVLQKLFQSHLEIDLEDETKIKELAEGIVAEFGEN
jgi:hypothetical protein